jgi:hypothetical protein
MRISVKRPTRVEGGGWVNWSGLATMFGEIGNLSLLNRVLAGFSLGLTSGPKRGSCPG